MQERSLQTPTRCVDLYSDYDKPLDPQSESAKELDAYVEKLEQIVKKVSEAPGATEELTEMQRWNLHLENFLKEMLRNILQDYNVNREINFCFCTSGSLAKQQATYYSDIDSFVIVEKKEDVPIVQKAMEGMFNLCRRIADKTKRLEFDLFGLNAYKTCGVVGDIIAQVSMQGVVLFDSLLNSRVLYSRDSELELYKRLHAGIHNETLISLLNSKHKANLPIDKEGRVQYCYKMAVSEFSGTTNTKKFSLKRDGLRPLEFILAGLREEFGIYEIDGSHLIYTKTLDKLLEKGVINPLIHKIFKSIYDKVLMLRLDEHKAKGEESDELSLHDRNDLMEIIGQIALLRGAAKNRLEFLRQNPDSIGLGTFDIDIKNPKYVDSAFNKETIKVDLTEIIKSVAEECKSIDTEAANRYEQLAIWLETLDSLNINMRRGSDPNSPAYIFICNLKAYVNTLTTIDLGKKDKLLKLIFAVKQVVDNPCSMNITYCEAVFTTAKNVLTPELSDNLAGFIEVSSGLLYARTLEAFKTNVEKKFQNYADSEVKSEEVFDKLERLKISSIKEVSPSEQYNPNITLVAHFMELFLDKFNACHDPADAEKCLNQMSRLLDNLDVIKRNAELAGEIGRASAIKAYAIAKDELKKEKVDIESLIAQLEAIENISSTFAALRPRSEENSNILRNIYGICKREMDDFSGKKDRKYLISFLHLNYVQLKEKGYDLDILNKIEVARDALAANSPGINFEETLSTYMPPEQSKATLSAAYDYLIESELQIKELKGQEGTNEAIIIEHEGHIRSVLNSVKNMREGRALSPLLLPSNFKNLMNHRKDRLNGTEPAYSFHKRIRGKLLGERESLQPAEKQTSRISSYAAVARQTEEDKEKTARFEQLLGAEIATQKTIFREYLSEFIAVADKFDMSKYLCEGDGVGQSVFNGRNINQEEQKNYIGEIDRFCKRLEAQVKSTPAPSWYKKICCTLSQPFSSFFGSGPLYQKEIESYEELVSLHKQLMPIFRTLKVCDYWTYLIDPKDFDQKQFRSSVLKAFQRKSAESAQRELLDENKEKRKLVNPVTSAVSINDDYDDFAKIEANRLGLSRQIM